jgi:hypothetical protein
MMSPAFAAEKIVSPLSSAELYRSRASSRRWVRNEPVKVTVPASDT